MPSFEKLAIETDNMERNFVSSIKERIHKASNDWKNNRMGQVEGETEFVSLPSYHCFK